MMKQVLLIIIQSAFFLPAYAQSCDSLYDLKDSAVIVFKEFDRKGESEGKSVYHVSGLQHKAGNRTAQVEVQMFNRGGIRENTAIGHVKCIKGVLYWDMLLSKPALLIQDFKNWKFKSEEAWLVYPVSLHAGDSLEDGYMEMNLMKGLKTISRIDLSVTDRRVEGIDPIRTPAGAWNCYRISYTARLRTTLLGIGIPLVYRYTEWFAPGFGLVKLQAYGKKHRISGSSELVSIGENP